MGSQSTALDNSPCPGVIQLLPGRNHREISSPNSCRKFLQGCLVPGNAQGAPHRSLELFVTRTPLPEPTQVCHRALGGAQPWSPSAPPRPTKERVKHNFSAPFPKGCVPGWTPVDTRVGPLRSSRSWECSRPGGVDADDSKNVPQCITESWKCSGSKGPERGCGMIYLVSALLHLNHFNFTPE